MLPEISIGLSLAAIAIGTTSERRCPPLAAYFPCELPNNESYRCDACYLETNVGFSAGDSAPFRSLNYPPPPKLNSTVYLMIMAPPNWGSSALENLIASSPAVSTMCNKTSWQCETTHVLVKYGLIEWVTRSDPAKADWERTYAFREFSLVRGSRS